MHLGLEKKVIIPFNRPYMSAASLSYIRQAHGSGYLSGGGAFSGKCQTWLEKKSGCAKALLTHSGTAALEMAAILSDIRAGDEIIMPSFSFVSTANAFVLRGGVPVFVDIRPDTFNIDERKVASAITRKTRAIVLVHYAGVGCEMDPLLKITRNRRLTVIEDAAHAVLCSYKGRPLGSFGSLSALSFHETKVLHAGEGGALLINQARFKQRAELISEKGTDRSRFFRGQVDKYTWRDIGSSYLPSELVAAFLWAQFKSADRIIAERLALWRRYHEALEPLEALGRLRRPIVPGHCRHNGHMYSILLNTASQRDRFIRGMAKRGINVVFHYLPLHESVAGRRFGRAVGSLRETVSISRRLVRLPLWLGLQSHMDRVINAVYKTVREIS